MVPDQPFALVTEIAASDFSGLSQRLLRPAESLGLVRVVGRPTGGTHGRIALALADSMLRRACQIEVPSR